MTGPTTFASKFSIARTFSERSPLCPASSAASTWTRTKSISLSAARAAPALAE